MSFTVTIRLKAIIGFGQYTVQVAYWHGYEGTRTLRQYVSGSTNWWAFKAGQDNGMRDAACMEKGDLPPTTKRPRE